MPLSTGSDFSSSTVAMRPAAMDCRTHSQLVLANPAVFL